MKEGSPKFSTLFAWDLASTAGAESKTLMSCSSLKESPSLEADVLGCSSLEVNLYLTGRVERGNGHGSNTIDYHLLFFFFFAISWAAPVAYGGSQARVLPTPDHSNMGSEQPTPQLRATPDP